MKARRLLAIVLKELRQLRRDKLTFAMIVGIPVMQLVLFGYAINVDVRHLQAVVVNEAETARSRELIAQLEATQVIDVAERAATPGEVEARLRRGAVDLGLVLPADLETRLERGDRPAVQLIVDGADPAVQAAARQLVRFPVPDAEGWTDRVSPVETVNFYNPERRAPLNTVPGLIGVILTMTLVMFTAIALVRERENGNLEMLIATPVTSWELTLGKVLPFVGIGLVQVTVVLGLGQVLFDVPVRGSILDLYLASLVFILASLALGIFLSTLARSQFQAMQMAIFTFLPQILLSGFMFPFAGMPAAARGFAELLPLTHFLRLVRGIMLRDATLLELWPALAALAVFTALMLGVAVSRMHKRLD
ncbi:ABC transporter permease [Halomonas getboli]|uniref:ABC transporter permease n=1 Tax=Halomonas getboli TaxID=2935862 RepID=UPI001FFEA422|nr:ABC transporter permease [Halomonas getboli]MCK2184646.1 ABC transporter permease [Halomonas getboli]